MQMRYKQDYEHISVEYGMQDKLNFLIIDDDIDLLQTSFDILTLKGHRVAMAKSSLQGLSLSQKIKFDVVLAELIMSEENCLDNYTKIKQNNPNTEVIITTGYSFNFPEVIRAKELGFEVVLKPFKIKDLLKRICL